MELLSVPDPVLLPSLHHLKVSIEQYHDLNPVLVPRRLIDEIKTSIPESVFLSKEVRLMKVMANLN